MTSSLRVLTCAIALTLIGAPSRASADDAMARQYFRRGVDLYDKKQYQPALESFRQAYAEKASPGIKQNVALCLKGLGRPVEAATAFDEALDEGADTLKPEVRVAMERELVELSKIVATVRITAIAASDKKPLKNVVVTVDGTALTSAALGRPVRLEPGIHVFTAHAEGLADPPEKKLSILPGSPVDATFELGAAAGLLTIRPSVADAIVQVDGAEVGRGMWSGKLSAGTHRVVVASPGFQTTTADVVVSSGASVDYPLTMTRPGEIPEYNMPVRKPPPPEGKKRYIVPMLAYEGESLRFAPILREQEGGVSHTMTGGSLGVRIGYRATRLIGLELHGEVGQLTDSYNLSSLSDKSTTKVIHWQLTPLLRFATSGPIRFTFATGVGVHGLSLTADLTTTATAGGLATMTTKKGSGVSASWLADLGMQFDIGSLFLEAVAFFDMHGVGSTRDDDTNERLLFSSPATRGGVRAGLGINF